MQYNDTVQQEIKKDDFHILQRLLRPCTSYHLRQEEVGKSGRIFSKAYKRKGFKPSHPIRKLVYEFERKTAKLDLGRMQHESIENWFNRIGLEGDIQIYQKVRYGEQHTSVEEEEMLKSMIKTFEKTLSKTVEKDKA